MTWKGRTLTASATLDAVVSTGLNPAQLDINQPHTWILEGTFTEYSNSTVGHPVYFGNGNLSPSDRWDGINVNDSGGIDYVQYDGTEARASASYTPGSYVWVAGVHDGTNLNIYTNGVWRASTAKRPTVVMNAAATLRIGGRFDGSASYYQASGKYVQVAAFNRGLSATQIGDLYEQSRRGNPDTLRWLRPWSFGVDVTTPAGPIVWKLKPNPQSPTVWEIF